MKTITINRNFGFNGKRGESVSVDGKLIASTFAEDIKAAETAAKKESRKVTKKDLMLEVEELQALRKKLMEERDGILEELERYRAAEASDKAELSEELESCEFIEPEDEIAQETEGTDSRYVIADGERTEAEDEEDMPAYPKLEDMLGADENTTSINGEIVKSLEEIKAIKNARMEAEAAAEAERSAAPEMEQTQRPSWTPFKTYTLEERIAYKRQKQEERANGGFNPRIGWLLGKQFKVRIEMSYTDIPTFDSEGERTGFFKQMKIKAVDKETGEIHEGKFLVSKFSALNDIDIDYDPVVYRSDRDMSLNKIDPKEIFLTTSRKTYWYNNIPFDTFVRLRKYNYSR